MDKKRKKRWGMKQKEHETAPERREIGVENERESEPARTTGPQILVRKYTLEAICYVRERHTREAEHDTVKAN